MEGCLHSSVNKQTETIPTACEDYACMSSECGASTKRSSGSSVLALPLLGTLVNTIHEYIFLTFKSRLDMRICINQGAKRRRIVPTESGESCMVVFAKDGGGSSIEPWENCGLDHLLVCCWTDPQLLSVPGSFLFSDSSSSHAPSAFRDVVILIQCCCYCSAGD